MNPVSLILLTFAMSTDAFAAAIGKGSSLDRPRLSEALRTGIVFGVIEVITPLIDQLLSQAASQFVADWDYWIAFVLMVLLSLHMTHNGLRADHATEQEEPGQYSFWILTVTALATSIGALAVDVGPAFVDVNIFLADGAIGPATVTVITLGTMLDRALSVVTNKRAEMVGGVMLVLVSMTVLHEHLRAA